MSQGMREEYKGEQLKGLGEDGSVIEGLLPVGWQAKAQELRALFLRKGSFKEAGMLLRVMVMHLSGGCSLRETGARAQAGGLVSVSEVALLKRLRRCGAWFQWLGMPLSQRLRGTALPRLPGKRIR